MNKRIGAIGSIVLLAFMVQLSRCQRSSDMTQTRQTLQELCTTDPSCDSQLDRAFETCFRQAYSVSVSPFGNSLNAQTMVRCLNRSIGFEAFTCDPEGDNDLSAISRAQVTDSRADEPDLSR
jgi:hypothetical protein